MIWVDFVCNLLASGLVSCAEGPNTCKNSEDYVPLLLHQLNDLQQAVE
jgi:hypothetical protein